MKKRRTMRWIVLRSTLVVMAVILAAYTFLLAVYYEEGIVSIIKSEMIYELSDNDQRLKSALESADYIEIKPRSYRVYQDLPDAWKERFADQTLELYEVSFTEDDSAEEQNLKIHIVMPYRLSNGRTVYATQVFESNETLEQKWEEEGDILVLILPFAIFFLLLILFVVIRLGRRLRRPADSLAQWADQLTLDNRQDVRPDFAFQELNQVADRLQDAFNRIGGFLERERSFLRHASHELRTPVAVVKANVELLNKCEVDSRIESSLGRIDRASRNMQQLIETLLWLSREESRDIPYEQVEVRELLIECCEELDYLLQGKSVTCIQQLPNEPVILNLPRTPFRILCSNLLHNAFQHTAEGEIRVLLTRDRLEICSFDTLPDEEPERVEESFGIGLELVRMLAKKMNWKVLLESEDSGHRATLVFNDSTV